MIRGRVLAQHVACMKSGFNPMLSYIYGRRARGRGREGGVQLFKLMRFHRNAVEMREFTIICASEADVWKVSFK